jgi:signal transduction histidine kinase/CheY-like chemotaxis protein
VSFLSGKEKGGLGVAVAALAANAVLTFGNLHGLVAVQRDVTRSHQVLSELARLDGTLRSAEAAQRTYLLTEGRTSLAALEAARTVLGVRLDRLGDLVPNDPEQWERISGLGLAARRGLAALTEDARQAGTKPPGATDPAAPPRYGISEGRAVREALDAVEDAERRTLSSREARAARRRFTAVFSAIASTLLGLCLVVVAFLLLRRGIEADAEPAAALEKANESLRDADRRKDEFLASLAHELRNPLAAMRNAVELLTATEAAPDEKTPERRALSRSILARQLAHLTRLVDDLLDLSRVTSNRVVLRKEAVALAGVVEAALEATCPALDARRSTLSVRLPEEGVLVEGDPVRLAQVLSNLLTNASRYAPEGGRIELAVAADEVEAVVRVTDDGIGLAPGDLERVFGMFEKGTERPGFDEGLGVGLALSRRLAQLHGGSLTASSPGPGRGSTFTLRLPRATAHRPAPAGVEALAPEVPPRRVLVVEDNVDGARALAEVLTLLGHEVHTEADGPSGVEAARRLRPDAVVLDLGLPGFDGYEVARRLRAEPTLEGTLLVALSGWAGREERARALAAGIDHHLVKPVPAGKISELLAAATPRPRT